MMKKIIFLFLLVIHSWAFAELKPTDNVMLPKNTALKFLGVDDENGAYLFEGEVKLKGLLEAGWIIADVSEEGTISHELELHFYPEQTEVEALPSLVKDTYQKAEARMIVFTNSSEESKKLVSKYFNSIPDSFFKYEEGVLKQPVVATIKAYKTFVECDSRYYQAKLVSLEKIAENKGALVKESGCSTGYAVDMYMTQAKDGYVNLRAAPSASSKVLKKLPNELILEKIKTSNNWFYVEFEGSKGYVHKSQVVGAN